jgi:hypothetical protein
MNVCFTKTVSSAPCCRQWSATASRQHYRSPGSNAPSASSIAPPPNARAIIFWPACPASSMRCRTLMKRERSSPWRGRASRKRARRRKRSRWAPRRSLKPCAAGMQALHLVPRLARLQQLSAAIPGTWAAVATADATEAPAGALRPDGNIVAYARNTGRHPGRAFGLVALGPCLDGAG